MAALATGGLLFTLREFRRFAENTERQLQREAWAASNKRHVLQTERSMEAAGNE